MMSRLVFFFQAEDGIRDIGVTGVQTCALPISVGMEAARVGLLAHASAELRGVYLRDLGAVDPTLEGARNRRSEERRVGKEGRSRWSPYHYNRRWSSKAY